MAATAGQLAARQRIPEINFLEGIARRADERVGKNNGLISLRKAANELERLGGLHQAAAECYALTLRSLAQYAVEVDAGEASEFRQHVEAMGESWRAADSPPAMRSVQASLRGELRDYQERTSARVARLRCDLAATVKAMENFASGMTASGDDHETQIQNELSHLDRLAESDSLAEMRRGIRIAAAEIAASLERMRREHRMVIAQLQDEIRVLHQEGQRQARAGGAESGVLTREKMDQKIAWLLGENQPFCLLFVSLRNLGWLERRYSRGILDGAVKALLRRVQGVVGADAIFGRWAPQTFAIMLDAPADGATALTREVTCQLADAYSVQENGIAHEVKIEVTAGALERGSEDEAAFSKKLSQLSAALDQD